MLGFMALLLDWLTQQYDAMLLLILAFFLLSYSYTSLRILCAGAVTALGFSLSYRLAGVLELDVAFLWLLTLSGLTGMCAGLAVFFTPWLVMFLLTLFLTARLSTAVWAEKFYSVTLFSLASATAAAALTPFCLMVAGAGLGSSLSVIGIMMLLDSSYTPLSDMHKGFAILRSQSWTALSITLLTLFSLSFQLRRYLLQSKQHHGENGSV